MLSYACNGGLPDNLNPSDFPSYGLDWPANGALDARLRQSSPPPPRLPPPKPKIHPQQSLTAIADGTSNTILFGENSDLNVWHQPLTEFDVSIVWQDGLGSGTSQTLNKNPKDDRGQEISLSSRGMTIGQMFAEDQNLAEAFARPSSQHPTGFHLAFFDGHCKFVPETIDIDVYKRIMTSKGGSYAPAGKPQPAKLPRPLPPGFQPQNQLQKVQLLQVTPVSDLD